jgi:hypothetical protein
MNCKAILDETRATYARLASYHDAGEVVSTFRRLSGQLHIRPLRMPFSTWFVRSRGFRFDYTHQLGSPGFQKPCTVWERDGVARANAWWTNGPKMPDRDMKGLANLLWYASIYSSRAATRVSRLLMPEHMKDGPTPEATSVHEGEFVGERCFALDVQWVNANGMFKERWWVDPRDFLIRGVMEWMDLSGAGPCRERLAADSTKLHAEGKISDKEFAARLKSFRPENSASHCERATTYSPAVDSSIPDSAFDVQPDN